MVTTRQKQVARFCGKTRVANGLYHSLDAKSLDNVLELFVLCPPLGPVDPTLVPLSYQGINYIQRDDGTGIWDAWDVVGAEHYPYWPWFMEEARELGVSRLFPKTKDLAKLQPGLSRHIILHPRGYLMNHGEYMDEHNFMRMGCVSNEEEIRAVHDFPPAELIGGNGMMCERLLWQSCGRAHESGRVQEHVDHPNGFKFAVWTSPEGIEGDFMMAILMSLPILQFDLVDSIDGRNEFTMDFLESLGNDLPVLITEE